MDQPILLNSNIAKDFKKVQMYRTSLASACIVDQLDQQLEELFYVMHPKTILHPPDKKMINAFVQSYYNKRPKERFGQWVFYPWNSHLVHILPEDLHTLLRTSRNRNLITCDEQMQFYNAHIGIAGLSVGNSVATTIAYSGGSKHMRLADYDLLTVANLNRIKATIMQTGLSKVFITARQIYELNPYADIILYPNGLTDGTINTFLLKPKRLDVVIDEIDNLYVKIQLRLAARKHKIPVIMATDNGDGILVDVERYDINNNIPLFHGDIPEKELVQIPKTITRKEAASIIVRLVGPKNVAPRMTASLKELGHSLYTWPQLGSAAFLAGCAASYAARKIVTGASLKQGKYVFSFDRMFSLKA